MTQQFDSWVYIQENDNVWPWKNSYTNTCGSIIHDSQQVETILISSTNKQYVVYPYTGILCGHNKEWNTDTCAIWRNLEHIMLSKTSQSS